MAPDWLVAATEGSETGALVRGTDWRRTSLGAPDDWPMTLRSAVSLCFGTRFPVLVMWGRDLTMIYNDGYRTMLGSEKHPAAMGSPARAVWGEIWDDVGPVFTEVMTTGRPSWSVDQRLLVHRSGFLEETYFTYSYSALRETDGTVGGVLDIAYETTDRVVDRRRLETVTSLSATLQRLGGGADELADTVIRALESSADLRSGALYRWSDQGLEPIGSTTAPLPSTVSRDVLASVAQTGTAVRIGACLIAPLSGTRDPRAVGIAVLEGTNRRPLDDAHRTFLDLLAATIGTALDSTLRHSMEVDELRLVSDALQRAMLPEIPLTAGLQARYRPADQSLAVGGDWYDAVDLGAGRRALVVGDCVGQGLEAAAVMGQLRAATRAIALENTAPAATLEALDRFAETLPGAESTTVFCVVVDETAGTLTYSAAGHPPPLLRQAAGLRRLDDAVGAPLAVHRGPRPERTVQVQDGDTLVLYTDGLVERRGESMSVGLRRLEEVVDDLDGGGRGRLELDELLIRMLPDGAADDVAALVHRVGA